MGASAAEIDQEIRDTRQELGQTLEVLEGRAARGARVYGRVAAGVAVGVAAVVVGVLVYRRRRQKHVARQVHRVLLDSVRYLPKELRTKVKRNLPIKIVIGEAAERGGSNAWSGIAVKIAPTLVGSAAGAVISRLRGTPHGAAATE